MVSPCLSNSVFLLVTVFPFSISVMVTNFILFFLTSFLLCPKELSVASKTIITPIIVYFIIVLLIFLFLFYSQFATGINRSRKSFGSGQQLFSIHRLVHWLLNTVSFLFRPGR